MRAGDAFRRSMLAMLSALRGCEITMVEQDARFTVGSPVAGETPLRCTVLVRDPAMYRTVALGGSVGVGEAYMDGLWDCDDLTTLVRVFVRNRDLLDRMETGLARLGGALLRLVHARRRNTRAGSRRNIAEHYDLGNELFRLFLDDNLMYSSAIFADPSESLETAQRRKLDRICTKLELAAGQRVVEIGTGWGGFALHAAARYGVHVTTTTISAEQHALATKRVAEAGLADRVTVLLRDYRDLEGCFDKLVSIEMIEAIGPKLLPSYFAKCAALLEPHGMALVQAITIEDHRYVQAARSVDFIKRFIFPGSFIPSVGAMMGALARVGDLKLFHLEDIGPSYAVTLHKWRERFHANLPAVRALGYPERFVRMWDYYLSYCEGGFVERSIGDVQMLLVKPDARRAQYLPDVTA
ncbi:MAG TPA: cyclopropane-fatty-acyl-phospholipid synthase family protein [Candidatus Saccharimonadia bacterium]|nr:cyclopropane-fatty-acyl-phospholipid synthase family protein [Candidatus Saccharimonadia bacterium]